MSRKLRRPTQSTTPAQKLRVLWLCPSLAPFTNGPDAETISALASALRLSEIDLTLVLPRYQEISPAELNLAKRLSRAEVRHGDKSDSAEVWEGRLPNNTRVFFLEHPSLFAAHSSTEAIPNDPARFAFFSLAALDLAQKLSLRPDIIHCHSWQTALTPHYLKQRKLFPEAKSVLTIHDVQQQGVFPKQWVEWLGLGWENFHLGGFEFYDQLSFLKAGIVSADLLTAPSPSYARAIQSPGGAFGLEGLLQHRGDSVVGICDGIDFERWDPISDPIIAQRYSSQDFNGRRRCKAELQRLFRLPIRENRPVLGLIAKATPSSGLDGVVQLMERILSTGVQMTCALTGEDSSLRDAIIRFAYERPDAVGISLDTNEQLTRKLFAGADFFLVPDLYSPCGSDQMKAMRYGAVPIAHAAGGIPDTIDDGATGFLYKTPIEEGLPTALERALRAYNDSRHFRQLQLRAMSRDFSWTTTALRYRDLYYKLVGRQTPAEEEAAASPGGGLVEKIAKKTENHRPRPEGEER